MFMKLDASEHFTLPLHFMYIGQCLPHSTELWRHTFYSLCNVNSCSARCELGASRSNSE